MLTVQLRWNVSFVRSTPPLCFAHIICKGGTSKHVTIYGTWSHDVNEQCCNFNVRQKTQSTQVLFPGNLKIWYFRKHITNYSCHVLIALGHKIWCNFLRICDKVNLTVLQLSSGRFNWELRTIGEPY